jgi:Zn-dependent protease with chaperone function
VQTTAIPGQRQARCPRCGATLAVDPGWPTWCDHCDWNVVPSGPPPSTRSRRRTAADEARAVALCDSVCGERPGALRRGGAGRRLLAAVYAVLAGVPAAALVAAAVADAILDSAPARVVIPIACLGVAAVVRPRGGTVAPDAITVTPASAPRLFDMITRVAAAIGAPPPALVLLDDSFHADYGVIGARRRRVLCLGVPLWTVLDDSERVALLAHQIAHDADGDPLRPLVAGEATATVTTRDDDPPVDLDAAPPGLLELPDARTRHSLNRYAQREATFRAFQGGSAALVRAIRATRTRVLYPANRPNEYLADDVAVRAASRAGVRGFLEKTLLQDYVNYGLRMAVRNDDEDLFASSRRAVAGIPPRELERVRRAATLRGDRVDATHPPTALRLRFVDSRPATEAQVTAPPGGFQAIDLELHAAFEHVAMAIFDRLTS